MHLMHLMHRLVFALLLVDLSLLTIPAPFITSKGFYAKVKSYNRTSLEFFKLEKGPYNSYMIPTVLSDAHSASSKPCTGDISPNANLANGSTETTLRRGNLLETVRPIWKKVTESEQRIAWLKLMIR